MTHRKTIRTALAALALASSLGARAGSPTQDYVLECMGCHGVDGRGIAGRVPPLEHAFARFMRTAPGRDYVLRVPGAANSSLSDAQLAAVLNWIAERFDAEDLTSDTPRFTAEEVTRARRKPLPSVLAQRREVVRGLTSTGTAPPLEY